MRFWKLDSTATLITLIISSGVLLDAQTAPALNAPIRSDRPLGDVADRLRHLFAKMVTYEDPIWVSAGELEPLAKNGKSRLLIPHQLTIALPKTLESERDVSVALGKMVAAYHEQTMGPRFRIVKSRIGLHIVPDQVRSVSGSVVSAKNPLDANVSVAHSVRLPSEHVRALLDSVSATTGIRFQMYTAVATRGHQHKSDAFDELFDLDLARFRWGTDQQTARDALIELIDRSATTFGWVLNYVPSTAPGEGIAYLNIVPLEVSVTDADGRRANKGIFYDRCKKCPALTPVPISPAK